MEAPADSPAPQDTLLVFDIDHFKLINERRGHDVGDEVLRRLVATVFARKRRSDLLFRIGGEEFLLLLPGASVDDAHRVADELRLRFGQADLLPTPASPSASGSVRSKPDRAPKSGSSGPTWPCMKPSAAAAIVS